MYCRSKWVQPFFSNKTKTIQHCVPASAEKKFQPLQLLKTEEKIRHKIFERPGVEQLLAPRKTLPRKGLTRRNSATVITIFTRREKILDHYLAEFHPKK